MFDFDTRWHLFMYFQIWLSATSIIAHYLLFRVMRAWGRADPELDWLYNDDTVTEEERSQVYDALSSAEEVHQRVPVRDVALGGEAWLAGLA